MAKTPTPAKMPEPRIFNAANQIAELEARLKIAHDGYDAIKGEYEAKLGELEKDRDHWRHEAQTRASLEQVTGVEEANNVLRKERDDALADAQLAREQNERLQAANADHARQLGERTAELRKAKEALAKIEGDRETVRDALIAEREAHSVTRQSLQDRSVAGPGKSVSDIGPLS